MIILSKYLPLEGGQDIEKFQGVVFVQVVYKKTYWNCKFILHQ